MSKNKIMIVFVVLIVAISSGFGIKYYKDIKYLNNVKSMNALATEVATNQKKLDFEIYDIHPYESYVVIILRVTNISSHNTYLNLSDFTLSSSSNNYLNIITPDKGWAFNNDILRPNQRIVESMEFVSPFSHIQDYDTLNYDGSEGNQKIKITIPSTYKAK